ncbi:MAG: GTPase Era [Ruaniaceae bacterium]|nr:GTPase Era [Ruaniaceae bacterium]
MSDQTELVQTWPEGFRAGFVAIVGRPNAGKSTLTNAMVGQKVAIMSDRPETTRRAIRGVVHRAHGQLVLVDTPGLHRPRTLLGERLNEMVSETLGDVDVVIVCLPADEKIGPGDRYVIERAFETRRPVIAVVTKRDRLDRGALAEKLIAVDQLGDFAAIIPTSGTVGTQVEDLVELLIENLPESPPLYPPSAVSDESDEAMIAEFVREAALEGVRDELPHSIAVVVEEMAERPRKGGGTTLFIYTSVIVERESQKSIVIGKRGERMRRIGSEARAQIEARLGRPVYLDLHVKVSKDWQRDPKKLGRLGF